MSHSLSSSETTNSSSLKAGDTLGGGGLATSTESNNNNNNNGNGNGTAAISNSTSTTARTNTTSTATATTKLPFSISLVQECSATKKGVLWEQQQNRFFFNRWKERFFILTTDYLTCFKKKGSKKQIVGMSEMGSFVYKVSYYVNWKCVRCEVCLCVFVCVKGTREVEGKYLPGRLTSEQTETVCCCVINQVLHECISPPPPLDTSFSFSPFTNRLT